MSFLSAFRFPSAVSIRRKDMDSSVMAESKTTSFGASVRYDSRDNPTTPASGILYSTEYQTGSKQTAAAKYFPQKLKALHSDWYSISPTIFRPFFDRCLRRNCIFEILAAARMDVSDLFRLGGASTLRGYREGQFLGSRIVWTNLEYRFLVAPRSFFYGFVDVGYIAQPDIAAIQYDGIRTK